jgi:hypothetical protein
MLTLTILYYDGTVVTVPRLTRDGAMFLRRLMLRRLDIGSVTIEG